jgi:predicted Rossmann fold flavoprotein
MDHQHYDLLIIGGGASGILSAIGAREKGFTGSILVVEKEVQPLRKVLASGNGRCNLASLAPFHEHYQGDNPSFVNPVFERYPAPEMLSYFRKMGLLTIEDKEQRVYPRSFQARSVTLLLLNALRIKEIQLVFPVRITELSKPDHEFLLKTDQGDSLTAGAVIVAAGSCASPDLGGGRLGYELLQSLGHRLNEPVPSLVPLTLSPHPLIKFAEGVRFRGAVTFIPREGSGRRTQGEYLITKYGLSGIAAMELGSAVAGSKAGSMSPGSIRIDFLPELGLEEIERILHASEVADDDWRIAMSGLVPDKIARALVTCISSFEDDLPDRQAMVEALASKLKETEVGVTGTRGFQFAQVASGGVATTDFDPLTLMSSRVPGLFACGEVLDVDGDTGGFNLLWAFASGRQAGGSAASFLRKEQV